MTILAKTENHLVEYEAGILTIARRSDGHCLDVRKGDGGIAAPSGDFRHMCKRVGKDAATRRFMNIALAIGCKWEPLYKARAMEGLLA